MASWYDEAAAWAVRNKKWFQQPPPMALALEDGVEHLLGIWGNSEPLTLPSRGGTVGTWRIQVDGRTCPALTWQPGEASEEDLGVIKRFIFYCKILGAKFLCVAGKGIPVEPETQPGEWMRIRGHINLTGDNPMIGPYEERAGPRFLDIKHIYQLTWEKGQEKKAIDPCTKTKNGVYLSYPFRGGHADVGALPDRAMRLAKEFGAGAIGAGVIQAVLPAAYAGMSVMGLVVLGRSTDSPHAEGFNSWHQNQMLALIVRNMRAAGIMHG